MDTLVLLFAWSDGLRISVGLSPLGLGLMGPEAPKMQKSRLLTGTLYVNLLVYLLVNKSNPGLLVK